LAELWTFIPITSHYPFFFKVILDKWLLRGQIRACAQSIHEAYQHGSHKEGESVDGILHAAEVRIRSVRDGLARGEFATTPEWIARVGQDLQARIEKAHSVQLQDGPVVIGVPTGIHQLDERTNGIGKGCIWIVKAATSDGKTAFAIQTAVDLAARLKPVPCVYYLTEGNPHDFWLRCIANLTRLSLHKLTRGDLSHDEQRIAAQALNKLRNTSIILRHKPGLQNRELLADMRLTTRKYADGGKIIHIVDYLQRIKGRYRGQNEQEHIQDTCTALTDLTGEMQTGTIILAQVNDEGKTRGSTSPDMDADVSLKISCPPMKDANGKDLVRNDKYGNQVVIRRDEGKRLFTFGKNRMGTRGGGPIVLDFNGDTATFR
jgi:replicative DNA helicase